jgi:hypothetical protein
MRKIIASLALLAWIAIWVFGVASLSACITAAPRWLQLVFYGVAGLGWVVPLKTLFAWMNGGPREEEE